MSCQESYCLHGLAKAHLISDQDSCGPAEGETDTSPLELHQGPLQGLRDAGVALALILSCCRHLALPQQSSNGEPVLFGDGPQAVLESATRQIGGTRSNMKPLSIYAAGSDLGLPFPDIVCIARSMQNSSGVQGGMKRNCQASTIGEDQLDRQVKGC